MPDDKKDETKAEPKKDKQSTSKNATKPRLPRALIGGVAVIAMVAAVVVVTDQYSSGSQAQNADLSEFRQIVAGHQLDIQSLQTKLEVVKKRIALMNTQLLNLAQSKPGVKETVELRSVTQRLTQLEEQLSSIRGARSGTAPDAQLQNEKYADIAQTLNKLQAELDKLNNRQLAMTTSLSDNAEAIATLKAQQPQAAEKAIAANNKAVKQKPDVTTQTKNAKQPEIEQIKELQDQVKKLEEQVKQLPDYRQLISEQTETISELQDQASKLQKNLDSLAKKPQAEQPISAQLLQLLSVTQVIRDRLTHGKPFSEVLPLLRSTITELKLPLKGELADLKAMKKRASYTRLMGNIETIYADSIGESKDKDRAFFELDRAPSKRCRNVIKFMRDSTMSGNVAAAIARLEKNSGCRTSQLDDWADNAIIYDVAEQALENIQDALVLAAQKVKRAKEG